GARATNSPPYSTEPADNRRLFLISFFLAGRLPPAQRTRQGAPAQPGSGLHLFAFRRVPTACLSWRLVEGQGDAERRALTDGAVYLDSAAMRQHNPLGNRQP